jgi:hypothetical protein
MVPSGRSYWYVDEEWVEVVVLGPAHLARRDQAGVFADPEVLSRPGD